MKNIIPFAIGVIILGIIGWFLASPLETPGSLPQNESKGAAEFQILPALSLKDYNGNVISLSSLVGKPLVINSWAAWCPFCRKELQDFAELQKEFGEQVLIIAIDRAETLEIAKGFSDELGVSNDLLFLLDPSDSFYQTIGGFAMPETIFVASDGSIQEHRRGPLSKDEIRQKIQNLIPELID